MLSVKQQTLLQVPTLIICDRDMSDLEQKDFTGKSQYPDIQLKLLLLFHFP